MNRPDKSQLLLPVNPLFLWFSVLIGLLINMMPVGRVVWWPDALSVILVFWAIHQPRRIGVLIAFFFGLLMDVHQAAILGQHAISYTLLTYFAITIHRRLLWFSVPLQALQLFPLFFLSHLLIVLIRMIIGGTFPGWSMAIAPLIETLMWPLASWLLLAPQRRAPDQDKHRPL